MPVARALDHMTAISIQAYAPTPQWHNNCAGSRRHIAVMGVRIHQCRRGMKVFCLTLFFERLLAENGGGGVVRSPSNYGPELHDRRASIILLLPVKETSCLYGNTV